MAKLTNGAVDHCFNVSLIGDIASHRNRAAARFRGDLLDKILAPGGDKNPRTFRDEPLRHDRTCAGASTRDDRNFTG